MSAEILFYQIGIVGVTIESDVPEVLHDFDHINHPFRIAEPAENAAYIRVYRRKAKPWARPDFVVFSDGKESVSGPEMGSVVPELEAAINRHVLHYRTEFLQLHAGVVAFEGRAIAFTGMSGAGKTTLAAGMLVRGWEYLSDEFALIEQGGDIVHPFPKALCIKHHGLPLIEEMGLDMFKGRGFSKRGKIPVSYVLPAEIGTVAAVGATPVKHVLFLTRQEQPSLQWTELSSSEAATALYEQTLNMRLLGQRGFEAAIALASQVTCYKVRLGSVAQNCELLESMMADRLDRNPVCQAAV